MELRNIFKKKPKLNEEIEERSYTYNGLFFNRYSAFGGDAMKQAAVYAAVNMISSTLACLNFNIYKWKGGERVKDRDNQLNYILNRCPDGLHSHFSFIKQMVESTLLRGNGYALIERDGNLNVTALRYIDAGYVTPMLQVDGRVKYIVAGVSEAVEQENIIHLYQHLDLQGRGISVIDYAYEMIKTATAIDKHTDTFYRSGANLSGYIKAEGLLNNTQKEQIYQSWRAAQNRADGQVGLAILPKGLDYQPLSLTPEQSQMLENKKFSVIEIARFFNISPIKLFDLEHLRNNSLEETQINYFTDTIMPWVTMIQDEFTRKLFGLRHQQGKYEIEMDFSHMLKADMDTEAKYYGDMIKNGIMSINEVRDKIGLDKIPATEGGDTYFMQMSYSTVKNIKDGVLIKNQSQEQTDKIDNNNKK